jgi:hypothetical protein
MKKHREEEVLSAYNELLLIQNVMRDSNGIVPVARASNAGMAR